MHPDWQQFLQQQHAVFDSDQVIHYGDQASELQQTATNTIMADLSHMGLICFSGEDAGTFLQSQLSCDVNDITTDKAQYGSYCTPKGRILASFLLYKKDDRFFMVLPASLCAAIHKRLSLFVLRAKVQINICHDDWIHVGVAGQQAHALIESILQAPWTADQLLGVMCNKHTVIISHAPQRFEIFTTATQITGAIEIWQQLSKQVQPVGKMCWEWLEIRAGIPTILPATQEQFLPQMVNLDIIGGVSFQKGCYPGQEIVARTQYLGKLKRRMFLANIATTETVAAGDDVFGLDTASQSCGKIVNAAPSPDGGYDVLAVIQQSSVNTGTGTIFWETPNGPKLQIIDLPYSIN